MNSGRKQKEGKVRFFGNPVIFDYLSLLKEVFLQVNYSQSVIQRLGTFAHLDLAKNANSWFLLKHRESENLRVFQPALLVTVRHTNTGESHL